MTKSNVLEALNRLIEAKGSQNIVAKALGVSSTTISQYRSGKYPGDVAKLEGQIEQLSKKEQEKRERVKLAIPYVQTANASAYFEVARACHIYEKLGVIYGPSGCGKTIATYEYVKQNADVILIEAAPDYTAKVLFSELHAKLGFSGNGSLHTMFIDCVNRLKQSGRLIIIDEAEHLPHRALELVRRLYDKAGVGILLVGMPRLMANLRGNKGEFAQLYSRVWFRVKLGSLTQEETEEIASKTLSAMKNKGKIIFNLSNGNARNAQKVLECAVIIARSNECEINESVLNETPKMTEL
jgi:DNA transposition AAA+ family ATPase